VSEASHSRTRGRSDLLLPTTPPPPLPTLPAKVHQSTSGHHGFRVSSPPVPDNTSSSMSFLQVYHLSISTLKFEIGSYSQSHLSWCDPLHCRLYLHLCVSLLLDTRRGVKTLCRCPFTVISNKIATSSNPGTVRELGSKSTARVFSDANLQTGPRAL
jgi:hypothetical protein